MSGLFQKNEVKTENIVIRVTAKQKIAIVERARDFGISVSEYILGVCGRDIEFNNWLVRNDIYGRLQELHEEVYSQGYDWSYQELCEVCFCEGVKQMRNKYDLS
jgi:hypothetical protein